MPAAQVLPGFSHFKGGEIKRQTEETNYVTLIVKQLRKHSDSVLFVDLPSAREVTCEYTWKKALALACYLQSAGYRKGDVACIFSYNLPEFSLATLGCGLAGLTVTTCNPLYTVNELSHQLKDSNSVLLFVPDESLLLEKANNASVGTSVKEKIILNGEAEGFKSIHSLDISNITEDTELPYVEIIPDKDIALILYSSGTTGVPKGVLMSHKMLLMQESTMLDYLDTPRPFKMVDLNTSPMFHLSGFIGSVVTGPLFGAKIVIQRRVDFTGMLEAIQKYKVSRLQILPAVIVQMIKSNKVSDYDLSSVKIVSCGSSPVSGDHIKQILEVFEKDRPPLWLQAYGMTEGAGTITPFTASKEVLCSGTVGEPATGNEVKVVDPETHEVVPVGQEGEIWTKSEMMMNGYLNRPAETANTITGDGWLRTGDIGRFNDQGMLFIADRLKELIKYKGYQVAPAELEALLLVHDSIDDVAVVGLPDEEAGELPVAFVVRSPGSNISEEAVKSFLKERAAPYKQLKGGVRFVDSIPRNATGKLMRRTLKESLTL